MERRHHERGIVDDDEQRPLLQWRRLQILSEPALR
jgi:hypothetical protein